MFSSEKPKKKTTSISKKNKPTKEVRKTTEEMPKSQSKGKNTERGAPSRGAPSRGAPSRGAPSTGAPSTGAPSRGASKTARSKKGGQFPLDEDESDPGTRSTRTRSQLPTRDESDSETRSTRTRSQLPTRDESDSETRSTRTRSQLPVRDESDPEIRGTRTRSQLPVRDESDPEIRGTRTRSQLPVRDESDSGTRSTRTRSQLPARGESDHETRSTRMKFQLPVRDESDPGTRSTRMKSQLPARDESDPEIRSTRTRSQLPARDESDPETRSTRMKSQPPARGESDSGTRSTRTRSQLPLRDESDPEIRSTRMKSQLPARGSSLNTKVLNKPSSRIPGEAKEKRAADFGDWSVHEQNKNSLRSARQPLPRKPLTQESSDKDEGEQSGEEPPLLIRRKYKSILKPVCHSWEPHSDSPASWDDADTLSRGQRTGKPSQNMRLRLNGLESSDEAEPHPEGTAPSAEPGASHLPAQGKSKPPRHLLDSDTEPETGEEELHRNAKVSWKKINDGVSNSAKAAAGKPRDREREKGQKTLELFSRTADGWSEKELQKLHRQGLVFC
ncbi:protein PRQFV-amide-like [Malurus melanocephalus]|uniref:protein PRQFV-amide-like n=1 Tax=Malurus melanocephalus TaxID=175006 RepID=UPI002547A3EA|nr:protein PRQFV-amide-like [Malurus melanocephalus]